MTWTRLGKLIKADFLASFRTSWIFVYISKLEYQQLMFLQLNQKRLQVVVWLYRDSAYLRFSIFEGFFNLEKHPVVKFWLRDK